MNSMAITPGAATLASTITPAARSRLTMLARYLVVTYAAVLINAVGFLRHVTFEGTLTGFFIAAVFLTYSAIYVLPIFGLAALVDRFTLLPGLNRLLPMKAGNILVYGIALVGTSALQVLLYSDRFVFDLYGFHFNGFVWNLVTTRGGIESMGANNASMLTFGLIIASIIAVQSVLLAAVIGSSRFSAKVSSLLKKRQIIFAICFMVVATGFERITYGLCSLRGYRPVLAASGAFPLYIPTSLTKIAKSFGMKVERQVTFNSGDKAVQAAYPRVPIQRTAPEHPLNLVWLVSESLRADMLDPEIMPNSWKLAQDSLWCRRHYSGGNGTRMGCFTMFYGLYGCLWFPIFEEQRSPVIIDVLQQAGYQMEMFTSASFTYPEFDRTMFVNVPPAKMHEARTPIQWKRDQENVRDIIKFIDERDPKKPFMTFMFFESPHAPYHFPQDSIIRKPYAEDMNYATMDLEKDIGLIKNRYINACHHLDSQVGRVLDYLREKNLMDSTIVVVTGDHGEEFMEKGRWGHNSEFNDPQTRAPLVIWSPGKGKRELNRMTSHLDIPATLLPMLGVTNPPQDYSLGYNLWADTPREYTVICDWNRVAFVDENYKFVMPFNSGFGQQQVSTIADAPVTNLVDFTKDTPRRLSRLTSDLKSFSR